MERFSYVDDPISTKHGFSTVRVAWYVSEDGDKAIDISSYNKLNSRMTTLWFSEEQAIELTRLLTEALNTLSQEKGTND